jgi:hypothetical protein
MQYPARRPPCRRHAHAPLVPRESLLRGAEVALVVVGHTPELLRLAQSERLQPCAVLGPKDRDRGSASTRDDLPGRDAAGEAVMGVRPPTSRRSKSRFRALGSDGVSGDSRSRGSPRRSASISRSCLSLEVEPEPWGGAEVAGKLGESAPELLSPWWLTRS